MTYLAVAESVGGASPYSWSSAFLLSISLVICRLRPGRMVWMWATRMLLSLRARLATPHWEPSSRYSRWLRKKSSSFRRASDIFFFLLMSSWLRLTIPTYPSRRGTTWFFNIITAFVPLSMMSSFVSTPGCTQLRVSASIMRHGTQNMWFWQRTCSPMTLHVISTQHAVAGTVAQMLWTISVRCCRPVSNCFQGQEHCW